MNFVFSADMNGITEFTILLYFLLILVQSECFALLAQPQQGRPLVLRPRTKSAAHMAASPHLTSIKPIVLKTTAANIGVNPDEKKKSADSWTINGQKMNSVAAAASGLTP